jgi:predicted nucleic acid-binding protein
VKVVLDANGAIEIALNKQEGERLKALLEGSDEVLAPDLLIPEFVNALWKYHEFNQLSLSVCNQALELLPVLVETFVPSAEIYREAFALTRAQKSRAAYDMFYLALALREDAVLLTLDGTLKKEARRAGIRVG